MGHPPSVIARAKQLEQVLLRVEQGEPLKQVRAELKIKLTQAQLAELQARYAASGRQWESLLEKRYGHPKKAHAVLREWLYARKRQDASLTAGQLAEEIAERFKVTLSAGHINYLLRPLELSGPPGRPKHPIPPAAAESAVAESLDNAGIFFPGGSETGDGRRPGH
jgi:transposase